MGNTFKLNNDKFTWFEYCQNAFFINLDASQAEDLGMDLLFYSANRTGRCYAIAPEGETIAQMVPYELIQLISSTKISENEPFSVRVPNENKIFFAEKDGSFYYFWEQDLDEYDRGCDYNEDEGSVEYTKLQEKADTNNLS